MIIWIGLGIIIGAGISTMVKRGRQGNWRFGIKEVLESFVHILGLFLAMSLILLGVVLSVPLVQYLGTVNLGGWAVVYLPLFYLILLLCTSWMLAYRFASWKPKYTEEEKRILDGEKKRIQEKILGFFRGIKIGK